jgi:hypothetical protein
MEAKEKGVGPGLQEKGGKSHCSRREGLPRPPHWEWVGFPSL